MSKKSSKIKKLKRFANFSNHDISNDGGLFLLNRVESKFGIISDAAKLVKDIRNQKSITHKMLDILKQRIFAICMGYEDLNDHHNIRKDKLYKSVLNKAWDLASDSTLCRIENNIDRRTIIDINKLLVEKWISSYKSIPKEIILDIDWTDVELHGNQEDRFYHGYYKEYCYIPLHVTCKDDLLISYLRPANKDGFRHSWAIIGLLIKRIRQSFPKCNIIIRADSGFMRHKFLGWLELQGVNYVIGMPRNKRLLQLVEYDSKIIDDIYEEEEATLGKYKYLNYQAETWRKSRNIISKIERNYHGSNIKFLVTNLSDNYRAKELYKEIYCMRGDMENKIKYLQLDLFGDRLSSSDYLSNSFRLMLSSLSYLIIQKLKTTYLRYSDLAKATANQIRLKLLKLAVIIKIKDTSIRYEFAANYKYKDLFIRFLPKLFAT